MPRTAKTRTGKTITPADWNMMRGWRKLPDDVSRLHVRCLADIADQHGVTPAKVVNYARRRLAQIWNDRMRLRRGKEH